MIYLYQLTVRTGRFELLQQSLAGVTCDSRLQLLLIAFALGALLEGAGGFSTPVAVCGSILISLGFPPIQAAGLCLIADTAPVVFGGLGIPIVALHGVTGLEIHSLSTTAAMLLTPFCLLLPFCLIWTFAGFRAMLEVWPASLVSGVTFSLTQLLMAVYTGPALVDIVAASATMTALILFLKVWKPRRLLNARREMISPQESTSREPGATTAVKAWLPWFTLSLFVLAWGIPKISQWLERETTVSLQVAGLHNVVVRIPPVAVKPVAEAAIFNLNWLAATGTGILIASVLSGFLMGLGPTTLCKELLRTLFNLRFTVMTISTMLALGYVMRYCGLDATLGLAFAHTGTLFPFFAPLIGWVGTATTGSDTASNVVFGNLQQMTARQVGVSPVLMSSANSVGGVMSKMIAAPSIVVASTTTKTYGKEGTIFRYVFLHSLTMGLLVGILVYLIAYVHSLSGLVAALGG